MIAEVRSFLRTVRFVITDTFKSRTGHRPVEGMARYWNSTGSRGGGVANTSLDNEMTQRFMSGGPGAQPTTEPVQTSPSD